MNKYVCVLEPLYRMFTTIVSTGCRFRIVLAKHPAQDALGDQVMRSSEHHQRNEKRLKEPVRFQCSPSELQGKRWGRWARLWSLLDMGSCQYSVYFRKSSFSNRAIIYRHCCTCLEVFRKKQTNKKLLLTSYCKQYHHTSSPPPAHLGLCYDESLDTHDRH